MPTVIIGIYRSDVVDDMFRFVFVCLIIPVLHELPSLWHRNGRVKTPSTYQGRHLLASSHGNARTIANQTYLKRFCLMVIHDQSLAMLAIVVTGIMEAIER